MKQLSRNVPAKEVVGEVVGNDAPRVHRRVEITVEREVVSILSSADQSFVAFCAPCNKDVRMLTPEDSARSVGATARAVYRWVEDRRVHFVESGTGKLFICSESLQALQNSNQISSGESR